MSQDRPPGAPLPYASMYVRPPNPRPTSVTVLAILAIIFGSLGVLGMLCSVPQLMGLKLSANAAASGIRDDKVLFIYSIARTAVGFVLAVLLLGSGVGMLSLRRAARKGMIWYAVLDIVVLIAGTIFSALVINPRMLRVMSASMPVSSPGTKAMMQLGQYVGIGFSIVLLIWPALILYYLSRPHVKAAFERTPRGLPALPTELQSPQP